MKTIEDMKLELLSDNSNKFMQTLIDYDIKSKDKYGSNLLHYYIMNYDSIVHPAGVIISEFIKKGLDINDKRKDGRTALYLSVQCQLQDIFEILLNSNADLDIQNVNGNTPLWASVAGEIDCCEVRYDRKTEKLKLRIVEPPREKKAQPKVAPRKPARGPKL